MKKRILSAVLLAALFCFGCADSGNTSADKSADISSEPFSDISIEESSEESEIEEPAMKIPKIYPLPDGEEQSPLYTVTVHTGDDATEREVPCMTAKVGTGSKGTEYVITSDAAFCTLSYDFSSPLYVTVTPSSEKSAAAVLPSSKGIDADFSGGSLTFVMTSPADLSVEFDEGIYDNLMMFVSPAEETVYTSGSAKVVYYGPGVHDAGEIALKSNQTLYIAGGAVVNGYITASDAHDITVAGRGVICGCKIDHALYGDRRQACVFSNCKDVTLEGVVFRDSSSWCIVPRGCEDVTVSGVREISYNYNSDGMDIVGCTNVTIDGVFLRTWDDCISIKASGDRDSKRITMKNSTLWADCAHCMLVGPEATSAEYENLFADITFENIDVLEEKEGSDFYRGVMALTCSDNAVFDGITWKDIRIERMTNGRLFNFRFSDDYGTYIGKAIRNITIENVTCPAKRTKDYIVGDASVNIESIRMTNIVIGGEKLTHDGDFFTKSWLRNIDSFIIDGDERSY